MGNFAADISQLTALGTTLNGLGSEASELKISGSATGASTMRSVNEAINISSEIVEGSLIPTIAERLNETGEIMSNVAVQFRGQDDSNAEKLATTYTNATGDWNTEDGR
ncbi:hypothetical protein [Williamsia sp. D3]|uniref:hypothetical protein n=1 Tax=Williamsia sp. D3 TaxID=1313067 RepID=UPI0003FCB41B|nr:hypothetical protein [Williamsia sp. D3]